MPVLSNEEVQKNLKSLPGWELIQGEIVHLATFKDFPAAISFVNQVAAMAESAGHHPDIDIRYNKVRLALISHDAGGLTKRDFALAAAISSHS
jgi:4a-hydroxytetrahydrobiopterin dehydratase